jgi:hypothetical protein
MSAFLKNQLQPQKPPQQLPRPFELAVAVGTET